jgi:hypothetical protein
MNGRRGLLGRWRTVSVSSRVRWWRLPIPPSRIFSAGREISRTIEDESFVIDGCVPRIAATAITATTIRSINIGGHLSEVVKINAGTSVTREHLVSTEV